MKLPRFASNLLTLFRKWRHLILILSTGALFVMAAVDFEYKDNFWGLIELAPSSYLVDHRVEILLALLAPQIPLLIFIFETASRSIFVRKTTLKALSFREFLIMLMSLSVLILIHQHPSLVIPLLWLVFVLDIAVFEIAYQLSNRSGRYKDLVKIHLSELVEGSLIRTEKTMKKHTKHTIKTAREGLLDVLDDINEGMTDSYVSMRSNEHLELLHWLKFIENVVDRESLKMAVDEGPIESGVINLTSRAKKHGLAYKALEDIQYGVSNWDQPRAMVHQKLMAIYEDQLQNALSYDNVKCTSALISGIIEPLRGPSTRKGHSQDINPFSIIRSDLLLKRSLETLIRRRHSGEAIGRAHEVAEFIAKEHLTLNLVGAFPARPTLFYLYDEIGEGDITKLQMVEVIYEESCLKTLSDTTMLSLRYEHQILFCELIDIYAGLDSHNPIDSENNKEFGNYVRCNLLTIYYYIRYHHDLPDAHPLNATIDKKRYEPLLRVLESWGLIKLTNTFEALEANQTHLYRWYVEDLPIPIHRMPHDINGGSIKLLWLDLLSGHTINPQGCVNECSLSELKKLHDYISKLDVEKEFGMGAPGRLHLGVDLYHTKKSRLNDLIEAAISKKQ